MSVHHLHAVLEALGDTDDHVGDVGGGGLDGGKLLGLSEPLLDLQGRMRSEGGESMNTCFQVLHTPKRYYTCKAETFKTFTPSPTPTPNARFEFRML